MSDLSNTSDEDSQRSLSLASLICVQASKLQAQLVEPEQSEITGRAAQHNLVDVLEKAMSELGYNREELQRIWLVFLAAHRAAVRAADKLPREEVRDEASSAARLKVCPLQSNEVCVLNTTAAL